MSVKILNTEEFVSKIVSDKMSAIVEFQAPWCVYCRRIGPAYSKIAAEYADKLIVAAVDIDNDPQLAGDYSIELVPTFILFKDGKPAARIVNPDSKAKLAVKIRNLSSTVKHYRRIHNESESFGITQIPERKYLNAGLLAVFADRACLSKISVTESVL